MKLPPGEKILEAYTALADGRVTMHENHAEVMSSDGKKTYTVEWEGDTFASTDSATYWQSYPGYPVIAVLIRLGRIPADERLMAAMKGIPWKKLNERFKRDYAAAASEAMKDIPEKEEITAMAEEGNRILSGMDLEIRRKLKKRTA